MPDLEMRIVVLLQKFNISKYSIGMDVACFIAEHVTSNIRDLEGAQMDAFARFHNRPITIELAKETLKGII